jgi:uncharacterized protein YecE (DUF72 family)
MGAFLYGTSSWSERSWAGSFYPAGTPPGEYLRHYARRFRTVEADVTYYRVPERRMIAGWDRKTPAGFVLAAKFPRSVVHGGEDAAPDPKTLLSPDVVGEEAAAFLEAMRALGTKCGPLVLQFPYFNRKAFARPDVFLGRLDAFLATLPAEFRYAVEVRNEAWIAQPLLDVLRRHRAALVLVEIAYMAHPAEWARRLDVVTTDFVYARLIGDRKAIEAKTTTFDRIVIDRSESLAQWADLVRELKKRVPATYVYANNHYAGFAPATIEDLAARVET